MNSKGFDEIQLKLKFNSPLCMETADFEWERKLEHDVLCNKKPGSLHLTKFCGFVFELHIRIDFVPLLKNLKCTLMFILRRLSIPIFFPPTSEP
jgi:hypothetical protein